MHRTIGSDILIIGSGAAGLRSAIEAYDSGTKNILIIGKCKLGNAHTVLATGGINAALGTMDPKDNYMVHAADTIKEGWFIADYRAVLTLCRNAPRAVNELVGWGARFHREKDGRLTQRFFGAHTYRRTCFSGDETGKEMMRVLLGQVKKRGIKSIQDIFIVSLLKNGNRISGAVGIDFAKGEILVFNSRAVIIAAGGYTKVYSRSSSRSFENHGDGAALALDSGVQLVDMEMVQFHPTGMVYPKDAAGTLVTEAVRGEGGILLNSKMERFMKRYDPKNLELGPRDFVARSIYEEIAAGRGTRHGGVWLDITMLPKSKILDRLPKMYRQFKEYDRIDISKERMEVAPTAHYTMGGVDVGLNGETRIKGLYAAGETVGQIHGANRLGGNSLLETMVYGRIVGRAAAEFAKKNGMKIASDREIRSKIKYIEGFCRKGADPLSIRNRIQGMMWTYVGISRNGKKLRHALSEIRKLRSEFRKTGAGNGIRGNWRLKTAIETERMFGLCEAIIRSAMIRKESRGAHSRTDYPKTVEKWKVNIISGKNRYGGVFISKRRVINMNARLKKEIEMLEDTSINRSFE